MINILEEIKQLMKNTPLPYGRNPVLMDYRDDGYFQKIAILCNPRSIISIHMHKVGTQMDCYVYEDDRWVSYQLGYILYLRIPKGKKIIERPPDLETLSLDARRLFGVKATYNLLIQYGDDVLKGEMEWTKETKYPPLKISDFAVAEIYGAYKNPS